MIPFIDSTVGMIASFSLLTAFVLLQLGKIEGQGKTYNLINFLASIILMLYAINTNSAPFIILNAFWSLAALFFLLRRK